MALAWGLGGVAGPPPAAAQTWSDALVAQVDGAPILASDVTLEDDLYGQGRSYDTMTPAEREPLVTRLIERGLLLAEAERFGVAEPAPAAVTDAVAALKDRRGEHLAGIDPATLRAKVRAKLWADAFVDARIRAFVFIRDTQVEQAVESLPTPATEAAMAALDEKVRRDLADREAAKRLARYLRRLEDRATIRRFPAADNGG